MEPMEVAAFTETEEDHRAPEFTETHRDVRIQATDCTEYTETTLRKSESEAVPGGSAGAGLRPAHERSREVRSASRYLAQKGLQT
jgi:hypothetical protein